MILWNTKIRLGGVGAMLVGGVWMIAVLFAPICRAVQTSFLAFRQAKSQMGSALARTEKDIPFIYIFLGIFAQSSLCMIHQIASGNLIEISSGKLWTMVAVMMAVVFVLTFPCSSICGYMRGVLAPPWYGSGFGPFGSQCSINGRIIQVYISKYYGLDNVSFGGWSCCRCYPYRSFFTKEKIRLEAARFGGGCRDLHASIRNDTPLYWGIDQLFCG